jgi:hypothetical protein
MKKLIWGIVAAIFFGSCVSLTSNPMTSTEAQLRILGEVKAEFTSFHFLHIKSSALLKQKAYKVLMDEAIRKYGQHGADVLDIRNISVKGYGETAFLIINGFLAFIPAIFFDVQDIECKGTVVLNPDKIKTIAEPLNEGAITKSFDTLSRLIPEKSKIAILGITPDSNESGYIGEELMIKFVNSGKYVVVDRDTLETIRQEQRFQMSGEVSDDSAVSIGHFLGADVVITGNITGTGSQRRLRLKALDVKTAQMLAMSSENI